MPQDDAPDWAAYFENDCQYAETVLLESSALFQMCIAHARDGTIVPVVGTVGMDPQAFHDMARLVCLAHDAIGLSCMGEAWIGGESVPDRVEAVCVALTYRLASGERQTMASLRTIERDASGKVVRLGEERAPNGGASSWCIQMAGAFHELLPDTVTEEERASAKHTLEQLAKAGAVKVSRVEPAEGTP